MILVIHSFCIYIFCRCFHNFVVFFFFFFLVYPTKHSILMCETLGALCSQFCNNKYSQSYDRTCGINMQDIMDIDQSINPFQVLLPNLIRKLESIVVDGEFDVEQVRFIEILSAVCLQSMLGYFMPQRVLDVFDKVFMVTSHWSQYRIARSASR